MIRLILILGLIISVVGCSSANTNSGPQPQTLSNDPIPKPVDIKLVNWGKVEVEQVTISRSQRFGSVNPSVLGTFTKQADIERFTKAFRNAVKIEGVLDIARPEFDLTFATEAGQETFHIWLGISKGVKGMYTYAADTGTGYTMAAEDTDYLRELIGMLPYTSEQAESNGDVVNVHGKIINSANWTRFLEKMEQGTPSDVQITSYTIEGDPIFQDLYFDGQAIRYTYDNTMDHFGSPSRLTTYCKNLEQEEGRYTLSKCDRESPGFSFTPNAGG